MESGEIAEAPRLLCVIYKEDGDLEAVHCDDLPPGSTLVGYAPKGTKLGPVDQEILNRVTPAGE